jgi:hypothetical protein
VVYLIITQDHVEGYHELSAKTKIFFSTAVGIWDADFYVKVDDDVHVNLGAYRFLRHNNFLLVFLSQFCLLVHAYDKNRNACHYPCSS